MYFFLESIKPFEKYEFLSHLILYKISPINDPSFLHPFFQCVSYPILSYPILSYPILSYPILSYPILSYFILSYPILSYPIYPILFYPSYPTPSGILYYPILKYVYLYSIMIWVVSKKFESNNKFHQQRRAQNNSILFYSS